MTIDNIDEDVLRELYWDKELSIQEIADKVDVSYTTIRRHMVENNIERRTRTEAQLARTEYNEHPGVHEGSNGYMKIYHKDVDGKAKQIRVHRLIAIAIYGIDAVKDMHVHHKSGHGLDNRHGNLALMKPEEHGRHHAEQQSVSEIT